MNNQTWIQVQCLLTVIETWIQEQCLITANETWIHVQCLLTVNETRIQEQCLLTVNQTLYGACHCIMIITNGNQVATVTIESKQCKLSFWLTAYKIFN